MILKVSRTYKCGDMEITDNNEGEWEAEWQAGSSAVDLAFKHLWESLPNRPTPYKVCQPKEPTA